MSFQEFIPPVDIPMLYHFPIVYFATAFLIIAILLEIINIFFKRGALSIFSLLVLVLLASLMTLAYLTVGVDSKELIMSVTDAGESGLSEYREFGVYLAYGAWALVLLKLLFMTISSFITRFAFAVMLMGYLVLSGNHLIKGVLLKEIYGVHTQDTSIEKKRDELISKYSKLKEELSELQQKYDTLLSKGDEDSKIEESVEEKAEELKVEEQPTEASTPTTSSELSSDTNSSDS